MDFEELLDLNYIRKEKAASKKTNQKDIDVLKPKRRSIYCMPLLLKHLNLLESDSFGKNFCIIKTNCEPVQFQRCLIYGRVMSKNASDEKLTKFILDDNSDTMQILAYNYDLYNITELQNEILAIEEGSLGQKKSDIIQSMKNIISNIKEQLNYAQISLGSRVLVCGRPFSRRDKIVIKAKFILQITSYLDIEIAFKEYLIDKYQTMF